LADRIAEIFLMKALLYHTDCTFFSRCQEALELFESKLDRAACFFWLNRASFSGTTCSGGKPQEHHARFTVASIEKARQFTCSKLSVEQADFRDSLTLYPDLPAYLDPPYALKSKLYGRNGDLQSSFPHEELAAILANREQWLLSYNNSQYIMKLYGNYRMLHPDWPYGMPKNKKSDELLILSHDIKIDHLGEEIKLLESA
jgi:DNA adenine methylase